MRKEIYQLVKENLLAMQDGQGESLIKHVDLFNQQILFITQERPFATPAVFIDFPTINWNYLLHGVREADVTFNLYVVVDSRTAEYEDAIEVFELHDRITKAFFECRSNKSIGGITLLSNTTDNEFDELRADVDTYVCHVTDFSTKREPVLVRTGDGLETPRVRLRTAEQILYELNESLNQLNN